MTTKELLIEARKLIEKPEHWTQKALWRSSVSDLCPMNKADSFCVLGALSKANYVYSSYDNYKEAREVVERLCQTKHQKRTAEFNDSSTHQEILELFDEAINSLP